MKVVRVHGWRETPFEDADAPEPAHRRTIVQMQAATVGHIDRTIWRGGFLRHPPLPSVPGVEAAGMTLEAGARVCAAISDPAAESRLPAGCEALVVDRNAPSLPRPIDADLLVDTVGGALLTAMLPALIPGGCAVLVGYTGGTVRISTAASRGRARPSS